MIKIMNVSGRSTPIVICDVCGKKIEDVKLSAAVYPQNETMGSTVDVLYVHKGQCHGEAEKKLGGISVPWQELSQHFSYLIHNIGLTIEHLKELDENWPIMKNLS